jgi:hypothetical protein
LVCFFYSVRIYFRAELNKEKEISLLEKTKLKDLIKKYETDFIKATGRQLTKEDREYHKEDFERYKVNNLKTKMLHLT